LIPDRITGAVEIIVVLADGAGVEPKALADFVSTWVRAVEIGLFGPGRVRVQQPVEMHGQQVSARLQSDEVSETAFQALSRMIRYFSKVKGRVASFNVFRDGQPLVAAPKMAFPALPESIPFQVEYPEDLKRYVRVEIEFRLPLAANERDAIFAALSVWDVVIEALAEEEWWGQQSDPGSKGDYKSRLLSPMMIEHWVGRYFASLECLDFIVWLALRLHRRLIIDRLTME
jgi:hypothetical protein